MELSIAKDAGQNDSADAGVSVLLLDSPENEGVDFLQALQKQGMKFTSERVNDKESLFNALKNDNWDILLVNDQVKSPAPEETLAYLKQIKSETGYLLLSSVEITIDFLTDAYKKGIAAVVSGLHPDYSHEVFVRAAERSRRNFQLSQLNQEKFELARHRDQLMSGTEEALAYLADGIHVYGNSAYMAMLGYEDEDDLIITPFIDIVSTEMREKVKQQLLDYQHKVRVKPDTGPLVLHELFVACVGEKEGIIDVTATFKPMVYDGEDCVQVIFKNNADKVEKEGGGAMEGLGYPLFLSHLDNFVTEAQEAGKTMGHVVHIRGSGFEHYIAGKGFGSLNGKMKALASELKSGLSGNDFMIRFTENSFLILLKDGDADDGSIIKAQEVLLGKFENALNKEIGLKGDDCLIGFSHDVVPVDAASGSAEKLIKSFLMGGQTTAPESAEAPAAEQQEAVSTGASAPSADEPQEAGDETATKEAPAKVAQESPAEAAPSGKEASGETVTRETTVEEEEAADESQFSQSDINSALASDRFGLFYEAMISVADIETEFYDVALYMNDGRDKLTRKALGAAMCQSPLAAKLDMWGLEHAVKVIGELYNQGEEYRIVLPFLARSLAEKRLGESVRKTLGSFALPQGMVVLDFELSDLLSEPVANTDQLDKLNEAGALICVSGVQDISELKEIVKNTSINLVRLKKSFLENAVQDEKTLGLLAQSIEKLHEMKIKVFAEDIDSSDLLSTCVKVRMDLVKGEYIQKSPMELSSDSLSQEMAL